MMEVPAVRLIGASLQPGWPRAMLDFFQGYGQAILSSQREHGLGRSWRGKIEDDAQRDTLELGPGNLKRREDKI